MREAPLALHLTSFSGSKAAAPAAPPPALFIAPVRTVEPMVTLSAADLEQRLAKVARDTEAALMAECERKLLAAEVAHRAECHAAVESARATWAVDEAERLDARLEQGLADMRSTLAAPIANALRHVLTDALVARALALFSDAVDQLLGDSNHPPLAITGPADLLAALEAKRGPNLRVTYRVGDAADLSVTTDQVRIESCLAAAVMSLSAES